MLSSSSEKKEGLVRDCEAHFEVLDRLDLCIRSKLFASLTAYEREGMEKMIWTTLGDWSSR